MPYHIRASDGRKAGPTTTVEHAVVKARRLLDSSVLLGDCTVVVEDEEQIVHAVLMRQGGRVGLSILA